MTRGWRSVAAERPEPATTPPDPATTPPDLRSPPPNPCLVTRELGHRREERERRRRRVSSGALGTDRGEGDAPAPREGIGGRGATRAWVLW